MASTSGRGWASQVGDPLHPFYDPVELEENERGAAGTNPLAPPKLDWGTGAGEVNRPEDTEPLPPHSEPGPPPIPPRTLV